jgi:small subunit ribosomal protein S21
MAIRIKARAGESAEQMMRRFKKMCEKEGLTKDVKRQAYYEKPSERARRSARKSFKRATMPPGMMGPGGKRGGPGRDGERNERGPGGQGGRGDRREM